MFRYLIIPILFLAFSVVAESPEARGSEPVHMDTIHALEQCESSGNPDVGCITDSNGELSCGILQYQKDTFWEANQRFPYFTDLEYGEIENVWEDRDAQEYFTRKLIDAGESWRWKSCAKKIKMEI